MKPNRPYPRVVVSKKAARSLAAGHPWVFEGEVLAMEPSSLTGEAAANGDIVDVVEQNGTYQGTGLLSLQSKIRVRVVSRNANDRFDQEFWRRKIQWAWDYRKTCMGTKALPGCEPDTNCCRLIFSEADAFPGLIVDRYEDVLVAQVNTVGMDRLRPTLYPLLLEVLHGDNQEIRGIYERNDAPSRTKEGLPQYKGWWLGQGEEETLAATALKPTGEAAETTAAKATGEAAETTAAKATGEAAETTAAKATGEAAETTTSKATGEATETTATPTSAEPAEVAKFAVPTDNTKVAAHSSRVVVYENGIAFDLDLENSQKTGFFLDQKYNRRAVRELAQGRRVLDCFCHVGPFGLNAAAGGAQFVRCVDVSQTALDLARENARLNGLDNSMGFTCANVLEYLPLLKRDRNLAKQEGGPFDLIVLDPPAFTKSRSTVSHAMKGYREINQAALQLLPRGGYLATCSCSHFMTTSLLERAIAEAAHNANVQLKQVEQRQQAPDHPILWGVPETHYLDFFIFQVV